MGASELRVVVIGAGIGGLSLGLALRERGIAADVFEQAPALTEIGAAIALSANATREYARLGLVDELSAAATIPTELIYRDWRTGDRIAAHPVGKDDWYVQRFGAPYFGIHGADLQKTLGAAFGMQNLHLGCRLVGIVEQRDGVVLEFANGRVEHADLVVGADGIRSTVRRWVTGADDAIYSGTSAFRGIVPTENLPSLPDPHAIQFWMGPDAHLLHYAIGGNGESVNFFAVVEAPRSWLNEGSVVDVPEDVPIASFRGWHPAVTETIRAAANPIRWGLFAVRPPAAVVPGTGGPDRGTRARDAAAPRAGREHGDRGHVHARVAARGCPPRRPRAGLPALPEDAPRPYAEDPAELMGDQRCAPPAHRSRRGGPGRHGGASARRVRMDPLLRRLTGTGGCCGAGVRAEDGMGQDDMLAALAEVLADIASIDPAGVTPQARFEDLGIDSLTMVDVVVAVEDRFGLVIPADERARFETVGDASAHVQRAARLPR